MHLFCRSREHGLGKCAMYGVCGERSDGKALNCPYSTLAVTVSICLSLWSLTLIFIPKSGRHGVLFEAHAWNLLSHEDCEVFAKERGNALRNFCLRLFSYKWLTYHKLFFWQPSEALSHKIQSLCPTLTGDVCCSSNQFERLREHVQQVGILSSTNCF